MESSLTTAEIIKIFPESIRFLDKIEHAKQILTDYEHPFDGYRSTAHSVLVFEEFRSSLRIQDMLNYLDGYPCELKARYRNKMAAYLYCYIISNVPLSEQYPSIQKESPDTWEAFLRRIQKIIHYKSKDEIITYDSVEKYFRRAEITKRYTLPKKAGKDGYYRVNISAPTKKNDRTTISAKSIEDLKDKMYQFENGIITNNTVYNFYRRMCKKLDIEISRELIKGTHSFRRNAITDVVNATGGNTIMASQLFGNSPEVAKRNYYTGADLKDAMQVLNQRKFSF